MYVYINIHMYAYAMHQNVVASRASDKPHKLRFKATLFALCFFHSLISGQEGCKEKGPRATFNMRDTY